MTVWIITDSGNEVIGVFDSESVAMDSLTFSYHKRHVKIETAPTFKRLNDFQIHITEEGHPDEHFRLYEEMVHSSRTHL